MAPTGNLMIQFSGPDRGCLWEWQVCGRWLQPGRNPPSMGPIGFQKTSSKYGRLQGVTFGAGLLYCDGIPNIVHRRGSADLGLFGRGPLVEASPPYSKRIIEGDLWKWDFCSQRWGGACYCSPTPAFTLELSMHVPHQLLLWGQTNRSYRIEFTDALAGLSQWTQLTTVLATGVPTAFTDLTSSNSLSRFLSHGLDTLMNFDFRAFRALNISAAMPA